MPQLRYSTPHGITVTRTETKPAYARGLGHILSSLIQSAARIFHLATNTLSAIRVGMLPRLRRRSRLSDATAP